MKASLGMRSREKWIRVKKTYAFSLIFCALAAIILASFPAFSQDALRISRTDNIKEYYPGDFVHVIVDAPIDTAQITATMPDGSTISLIEERRSTIWRGIWQVPLNFKKGSFTAKLSAVDVDGNIFEGQSAPFVIKELAIVTLVGLPTKEAAPAPAPAMREKITPVAPEASQAELINIVRKLIAEPVPGPVPELKADEKAKLFSANLSSGKKSLEQGRLQEAAAYFRVALFLDPKSKEAGSYLLDAQNRTKAAEQAARRRIEIIAAASVAGLVFIYIFFQLLVRAISRCYPSETRPVQTAEASDPEKKKKKDLKEILGWKGDPFSEEALKDVIIGDRPLGFDGLKSFIRNRIEAVNGSGLAPFTESALKKIYEFSKGKPTQALDICRWAVGRAAKEGLGNVTAELVDEYSGIAFKKILIADDEEVIRSTLAAILKKGGGYEVEFATDGEDVLKKIKENNYGAVLLDIVMPKLDGYQVLSRIREISPELPVIFVSGKGDSAKVMNSLSQNRLSGLIEKPFTPEAVLDAVAKAIKLG